MTSNMKIPECITHKKCFAKHADGNNCGSCHASFVTHKNEAYMFGKNSYGQCGFNSPNKIIKPHKLLGLDEGISNI